MKPIAACLVLCLSNSLLVMNNETAPVSAKLQASIAAAAPLLVCPPFMAVAVPTIAATLSQAPIITKRASTIAALSLPMNGIATAIGDKYIEPQSSALNAISKYIASFYLSNQTSNYLTHIQIIPPAPHASTYAEMIAHAGLSYGISEVTRCAIQSPYDQFMINIDADYKKKDGAIVGILQTQELTDQTSQLPGWNPSNNEATKHIHKRTSQKETDLGGNPEKPGISCRLFLLNGAIAVSEGIWQKNATSMQCLITKYTTNTSEWHYLRPFAASAFSKEIKPLQRTVYENHVTLAGIPLKEIITLPSDDDEAIDL